ncbi:MAG: GNAT family N-acetyltransferase [Candidatus Nanopelagicales bacterium]
MSDSHTATGYGLVLRHSTDDDVPEMLDLAQRGFAHVTGRLPHWSEAGLRRMRHVPGRDAGRDFPVVTRDGAVVAWGGVFANAPYSETFVPIHPSPDLDPDDLARTVELLVAHAAGVVRGILADEPHDATRTLATEIVVGWQTLVGAAERVGFACDRHEYEMGIELDPSTAPPVWPDGVRREPLHGPQDAATVTAVLDASFGEHPGDLPFSLEMIEHVLGSDDFDAHASAIAYDDDGPVGVVLSRGRTEAGYVWVVGVDPRWRRRGLGAALLTHAFHAYATTGRTLVTLDVDGANDSGALVVYERAGMSVRTENHVMLMPLDAVPATVDA